MGKPFAMLFAGLEPASPGQLVQLEAELSHEQDCEEIRAVPSLRL